jgi:hypothetical protein
VENILLKLSSAASLIRGLCYILNLETLRMMYLAYFHSILRYGIIFWDNSTNASKVVKLLKKAVRIMCGVGLRNSCRGLFFLKRLIFCD